MIATTIFGLAIRQLGAQALFNGNFFGHGRPVSHAGMYALLADPMYVGYTLSFVALALTDHGVMNGSVELYKATQKHGIKPIIGCEVYVVEDHARRAPGRLDHAQPLLGRAGDRLLA